jgi:hypothetical protein
MSLKLTIFKDGDPHPKSKEEKMFNSKFASFPFEAIFVKVKNEDELVDLICNNIWSPFTFEKYRRQDDFISTDIIAFDIDDGMSIEEAEEMVEKLELTALCLPSTSHTPENHRFRLIFPLSITIFDPEIFKATYAKLAENFTVDPQCKDYARFYFGSNMSDGFWIEGDLLSPELAVKPQDKAMERCGVKDDVDVGEDLEELVEYLYGEKRAKIPEQVAFFLENAHTGLSGLWHTKMNSFVFTLGLTDVNFDAIVNVVNKIAPNDLDDHDDYLLDRAYRDGQRKRNDDL